MKFKKMLSIFALVAALLTFTQSAFADGTPINSWTVAEEYGCKRNDSEIAGGGTTNYAYMHLRSGVPCWAGVSGTTYVSNANQILIDWSFDSWDSGIGGVELEINRWDGSNEYIDLDNDRSYDNGTTAIDVAGYTGYVTVKLVAFSSGLRIVRANIDNITFQ
ncbi:hypothetical protein [Paenibacillus hamazuiensis]|uniref:hypothetical protein n=1 Tax=Paenibacillus hamazuiensis TaxID=2936508 RepID=UPI00200E524C|nr:hypothetical protein [Paenibacillus hamazuiensis]